MQLEVSTVINKPVGNVFQFVAVDHFQNHPRWDPSIVQMTPTTPGPIRVGTTCQVIRKQGPGSLEVTAFEPDRLMTTSSIIGPFILVMTCRFDPQDRDHTRLLLHADTRAHGMTRLIAPLLKPIFRRTMRRSLATIKTLVEEGS